MGEHETSQGWKGTMSVPSSFNLDDVSILQEKLVTFITDQIIYPAHQSEKLKEITEESWIVVGLVAAYYKAIIVHTLPAWNRYTPLQTQLY